MELVLRTFFIYLGLLLIFRLMGRRSLSHLTSFDLILFLVISESVQNALIDDDRSVVMGLVVVLTFLMLELGLSLLKRRFKAIGALTEGAPVLLIDRGRVIEEHLRKSRVGLDDVLQTARETSGLGRLQDIKYAILETSGQISIIPREDDSEARLRRIESQLERIERLAEGGRGG